MHAHLEHIRHAAANSRRRGIVLSQLLSKEAQTAKQTRGETRLDVGLLIYLRERPIRLPSFPLISLPLPTLAPRVKQAAVTFSGAITKIRILPAARRTNSSSACPSHLLLPLSAMSFLLSDSESTRSARSRVRSGRCEAPEGDVSGRLLLSHIHRGERNRESEKAKRRKKTFLPK